MGVENHNIVTFRVPIEVKRKLAAYKRYINVTDVCREALLVKIEEVEAFVGTVKEFECGILETSMEDIKIYQEKEGMNGTGSTFHQGTYQSH